MGMPGHIDSWYAASATPLEPFPSLQGEVEVDVCIVGGGYTGLSSALHLRERGLINLLENKRESLLCDDVEQMARVAQSLGLIDELTIEEVHIELRGVY